MSDSANDCIFCKIASGSMGTSFVAETEHVVAFDDIAPVAPTHVLVVPKKHIQSLHDVSAVDHAIWTEMLGVVQEAAVVKGVSDSGYRVVTNIGPDSGQEVPHLHLHVIGGRKLRGIG
jgi:histidine triad (HIT) family protein